MEIEALLEVEEGADGQLQQAHGARWACVRSSQLTGDARVELDEARAELAKAADVNAMLQVTPSCRGVRHDAQTRHRDGDRALM